MNRKSKKANELVRPKKRKKGTVQQEGTTRQKTTFRPPSFAYTIALTYARFLVETRPMPTQEKLAELAGVSRQTVNKFLVREEAQDWLADELTRLVKDDFLDTLIRKRLGGLALAGNLNAIKLWGQLQRWFEAGLLDPAEPEAGTASGYTLNLLVPRPDMSQFPGATLGQVDR